MRILIDECLPRRLKEELSNFEVKTVSEAGWAGQKNGDLLRLMAGNFDVFITIDSHLQDQQRLDTQPIGFVILSAPNNKFQTLQALMPDVRTALEIIQPGQVIKVLAKSE